MKLNMRIAVIVILGSIAVEGYGPNFYHRRRGAYQEYSHEYSHGFAHRNHFNPMENLGRNGPYGLNGHYDMRMPVHQNYHHRLSHEDSRRQWYNSESSESDSGSNSEEDDDYYNIPEYNNWHRPGHRPCWGWRCPPQDKFAPWEKSPSSNVASPEVPSSSELHMIDMLKLSLSQRRPSEPVETSTHMPTLTVAPCAKNTKLHNDASTTELPFKKTTTDNPALTISLKDTNTMQGDAATIKDSSRQMTVIVKDLAVSSNIIDSRLERIAPPIEVPFKETTTNIPALPLSRITERSMQQINAHAEEGSQAATTILLTQSSLKETATTLEIIPTTMSSPETTTISQAILDCIENCVTTPEFNPVCGTNDETYNNLGRLFCAKSCGINVELRRMSRCWPVLPFADDYNDGGGNDRNGTSDNSGDGNGDDNSAANSDEYPDYEYADEGSNEPSPPQSLEGEPSKNLGSESPELLHDERSDIINGLTLIPESVPSQKLDNVSLQSSNTEPSQKLNGRPPHTTSDKPAQALGVQLLSVEPFIPNQLFVGEASHPQSGEHSQPIHDEIPQPVTDEALQLQKEPTSPPSDSTNNTVVIPISAAPLPITNAPRFRRTTHLTELQRCMKQCPITTIYNPICGTDLVTYINVDRIECARGCGLEVQILCEQPCHMCNMETHTLSSIITSSTMTSPVTASSAVTSSTTISTTTLTTTQSTTDRNVGKSTPVVFMEQCFKSCPVTTEHNPVCGTNNVNYTNPVHLLCAQICGDDVKIASFGPCPGYISTEPPYTRAEPPNTTNDSPTLATPVPEDEENLTLPPQVVQCIRRCIVTPEYNPVCGTNEETYTNPGRLECAKFCGVDVELSYKGLCNGFFFAGFTSSKPNRATLSSGGQTSASWEIPRHTTSSSRLPLRTSTLTPTQSTLTTILTTSQSTQSFVPLEALTDTSSISASNIPTTTVSILSVSTRDQLPVTILTSTESPKTTKFTIAPNVLNSIFGDPLVLNPTTDMSNEENYSLDPRFGTEDEKNKDNNKNLDPNRIVFPD